MILRRTLCRLAYSIRAAAAIQFHVLPARPSSSPEPPSNPDLPALLFLLILLADALRRRSATRPNPSHRLLCCSPSSSSLKLSLVWMVQKRRDLEIRERAKTAWQTGPKLLLNGLYLKALQF
jgi:hypothetical protein